MNKHGGYDDSPILAELYDLVPGYINRPDREFYLEYCRSAAGKILELGCGTGRILIPAAEAGCNMTGLDKSEHMLAQCRKKLGQKSEDVRDRVRLIQGDMTDFALEELFELVIIPFRAFQHLISLDDQMSCLEKIHAHLAEKGKLIIDFFQVDPNRINNPAFSEEMKDFDQYELPDGRRLRRNHRVANFHPSEQYNDVELIYYLTGREGKTERIVHAFPFRYFFRYELEHLFARCHFKVINLYGDFDKSPLIDESNEMIFITEKTG